MKTRPIEEIPKNIKLQRKSSVRWVSAGLAFLIATVGSFYFNNKSKSNNTSTNIEYSQETPKPNYAKTPTAHEIFPDDVKIDTIFRIQRKYPNITLNYNVKDDRIYPIVFNPLNTEIYAEEIEELSQHDDQLGFFNKENNYGYGIHKGFINYFITDILEKEMTYNYGSNSHKYIVTETRKKLDGYVESFYAEMLTIIASQEEVATCFFNGDIQSLEDLFGIDIKGLILTID